MLLEFNRVAGSDDLVGCAAGTVDGHFVGANFHAAISIGKFHGII